MRSVIYKAATGEITKIVECPAIIVLKQVTDGEAYIECAQANISDATHYVSNGDICSMPQKCNDFHVFNWLTKTWVDPRTPQDFANATASLIQNSLATVDTAAGSARLKYITSVPGQSETYQRKEEQARAWQATSFAGDAPSFIAAEATALAIDAQVLTLQIIALADYWGNVKGPQIEAARRKAKVAIESAGTDDAAIIAARDAGITELASL